MNAMGLAMGSGIWAIDFAIQLIEIECTWLSFSLSPPIAPLIALKRNQLFRRLNEMNSNLIKLGGPNCKSTLMITKILGTNFHRFIDW